jgi:hypothetical protein
MQSRPSGALVDLHDDDAELSQFIQTSSALIDLHDDNDMLAAAATAAYGNKSVDV